MRCVTFIAWLWAAVACESTPKPKPPPPPPTAPVDGVEVIHEGAEPRTPLRYRLAKSERVEVELATDLDLRTEDRDVALPTLVIGIDVVVVDIDPAGNATLKMTVVSGGARSRAASTGAAPDTAEAEAVRLMDRQSAQLVGLAIGYTLSPSGVASHSKIDGAGRDLSGPMTEQITSLLQMVDQLAMRLPDKPLGAGAVWKRRETIQQSQITLVTNTTVEVTAIEGTIVAFKSTTEMTGADQVITQGSASAQVTGIRGTGSATGKLDLAKAIVHGEARATLELQMIVGGQTRATKLDNVMRFAPRGAHHDD